MKLKLILILISTFQLSAAVHSQNNRLTLQMENVSLEEVIWEIQKRTNFVFMYGTQEIAKYDNMTVSMEDKTIQQILDFCLQGTGLAYEISGNAVVIKRTKDEKQEKIVIKGVVKDVKGEPLAGATIIEKGTMLGVATDMDGKFTYTVAKHDGIVLVISFVGMKSKEVKWVGQEEVKVVLLEDEQLIDEVVITGYQTVKKSNMAGAISTVKAEDLTLTGTHSLEQALQGKLAGVAIQSQDGLVGTRQKVRVRGTSTLLGSQEPVWVVDGMIQEDPLPFKATDLSTYNTSPDNIDMIRNFVGSAISWLNPSDIKDVTVLKDASATAIYGVKAANGVIVITTRKGEKGRMSIRYSGNFSIGSKVTYDKLNLMNSKERVDVSREVYEKGLVSSRSLSSVGYEGLLQQYLQEKISYNEFNAGVKKLEVGNTDWFDILFENPFSHSNNISISGGSEKTTYYASFGVTNNNGTAKGNDSKSYQGSINVNTVFWNRLQFSARVSGNVSKTNGFHSSVVPYSYASTTSRVLPAFDEKGDLAYYNSRSGYKFNVLNELAESGNKNISNALNVNIGLNVDIIKGLKYEMSLGYGYTSTHGESWATEMTNYIAKIRGYEFGAYGPNDIKYQLSNLPHGGELNTSDTRNENYTWRNQLSYVRSFGRHLLTATVGQEASSTKYDGSTGIYYGYLPGRGKTILNPPLTTQNGSDILENTFYAQPKVSIIDNKSNKLSFYGAFTYTFDERYVFNASIRSDASNRFGQDKSSRFLPVWSMGLRWNMGREHFLEGQDFLNEFSLRLTYGYQGNASEAAGPELIAKIPTENGGISDATGEYYMQIKSLPNPNLKWEKTATINAGIDFVFWKNKINGSFEYYHKKTTDAIINKEVPYENGVLSMPMNGGSLENYGWELAFSFAPVRTKNFIWTVGMNTSKNYNKVTSPLESNKNWTQAVSGNLNKEGYPVSSFWAFDFAGLNPDNGIPMYNLEGVDTKEALTDATVFMKYMGKLDPDFTAGLNMGFRFKNLTLSSAFYLSVGGKKFLAKMFDNDMVNSTPYEYNNLPKDLVHRWRKPGDEKNTMIPSLPEYGKTGASVALPSASAYSYELYNYSNIRVVNASYLRCNNISLSYNLSKGWIKRFAQNMAFSFSVSNPFMIVSKDFKGKDPEVATGSQPLSQNYTFSVNLSF